MERVPLLWRDYSVEGRQSGGQAVRTESGDKNGACRDRPGCGSLRCARGADPYLLASRPRARIWRRADGSVSESKLRRRELVPRVLHSGISVRPSPGPIAKNVECAAQPQRA